MDLLTKQKEIFKSLKGHVPVINPFLYCTDFTKFYYQEFTAVNYR